MRDRFGFLCSGALDLTPLGYRRGDRNGLDVCFRVFLLLPLPTLTLLPLPRSLFPSVSLFRVEADPRVVSLPPES